MGKPLRYIILMILSAAILLSRGTPGSADSTLEDVKKLLQKGLTLVELDQEIARLSSRELKIEDEIVKTEEEIVSNQEKVAQTREHAAKVLRAYYMGDRDNLWMMLFTAKSLSEALSIYEYLSVIASNDHHSLDAYSDSYRTLTDSKKKLEDERQELQEVKASFISQREKALAVQKEIDETLAASTDAEALKAELDKFTTEWKEKGIPLFRTYLTSISQAMQSLPELLSGKNAEKYLKVSGLSMVFSIPETDLIEFFRSKNPLFQNITFQFADDSFQAFGNDNGTMISITGRYTVENDPVNRLQFHVDQLSYNGFILPDTSNRALEQEFDLGFTPSKHVKDFKFQVTEVTMKDGKLSFKLKLF